MVQLVALANTALQAHERYYLENGVYAHEIADLELEWPGTVISQYVTNPVGWTLALGNGQSFDYVTAFDSRLPGINLGYMTAHHPNESLRGARFCYADIESSFANTLCKNVTRRTSRSGTNGVQYFYEFSK